MQVRDCQETVPKLSVDPVDGKPVLFRTWMPMPPREATEQQPQSINYAASMEDLAETLVLMCEHNQTAAFEHRKAFILSELERHAELPKRP